MHAWAVDSLKIGRKPKLHMFAHFAFMYLGPYIEMCSLLCIIRVGSHSPKVRPKSICSLKVRSRSAKRHQRLVAGRKRDRKVQQVPIANNGTEKACNARHQNTAICVGWSRPKIGWDCRRITFQVCWKSIRFGGLLLMNLFGFQVAILVGR